MNTPSPIEARSLCRPVVSGVVWLGLIACIVAIGGEEYQWDFHVYGAAVHAFSAGEDPYRSMPGELHFLYAPMALWFFEWTRLFSPACAALVWLALKVAGLWLLARLWYKHFGALGLGDWRYVLFLALGFNAAILRDVTCGNVSVLEELGLWYAFSLLLRNRPYAAAIVLAGVAQFKILPAALIGVIPLAYSMNRWKPFAVGLAAFFAFFCLNFAFAPDLTGKYLEQVLGSGQEMTEWGLINPSALALSHDIANLLRSQSGLPQSADAGTHLYLVPSCINNSI